MTLREQLAHAGLVVNQFSDTHWRVSNGHIKIDFWPTTQMWRWFEPKSMGGGKGIGLLLEEFKKNPLPRPEDHDKIMEENYQDSQRKMADLQRDDWRINLLTAMLIPFALIGACAFIAWLVDLFFKVVAR